VQVIRQAVAEAGASLSDVAAVGLGVPGRVDAESGLVHLAVNLPWRALPVGARLADELGAPCFLENDARAAALGLHRYTPYGQLAHLAYVSVGTGIAAGLILHGRLYKGAHGMAGEIGHVCADPAGPACGCGLRGCLEAVAAGPAIARWARQALEAPATAQTPSRLRARQLYTNAQPLTAAEVYAAAATGDALAQAVAQKVAGYLAQAVQGLVMAYDVERIVIGGGVARAGAPFLQPLLGELARLRRASPLAQAMLPESLIELVSPDYDAGAWGAVAVAQQGIYPHATSPTHGRNGGGPSPAPDVRP
jgi:glucokinase